ncbi:UNVERIFIED_CONTAM: hypothetical protein FKN15_013057 [Acipenser sinensis]
MATDEKPSSSTLDLSGEPLQSPSSPPQLTHFKPLTPEQEEPPLKSAYSSFVSLFRFSRGNGVQCILDQTALTVPFIFVLQDSDLKQYWMPDSQCKECYDCNEKFTTFRRRHHCRLCGQIFCSRCCNQEIPGKFMGYTGE